MVLNFSSFQTNHTLQAASDNFKVLTNKGVISSAIASAIIVGIGLIFFALFMWKRKNLDPPSYIDLEKANKLDEKGPTVEPGEGSPKLPIQPADKTLPSSEEKENPFTNFGRYTRYHESLVERTRGHSRNGSNASSITVYSSNGEALQKRAPLTSSVLSTDSTCRESVSDYGSEGLGDIEQRSRGKSVQSISSAYSDDSQYSQTSEKILINNVWMPPQFSTPIRPPSVVSARRSVQCELVSLTTQFASCSRRRQLPLVLIVYPLHDRHVCGIALPCPSKRGRSCVTAGPIGRCLIY